MDEKRKKGRPPVGVKSKKRSMVFPAGLYQRLEEVARRQERPVSELIVEAVRRQLAEMESGNTKPAPSAA